MVGGTRSDFLSQTAVDEKYVHFFFADNIDTRSALESLRDCITYCNIYVKESGRNHINAILLKNIAIYITKLLQIFGVIPSSESIGFPLSVKSDTNVNINVTKYNFETHELFHTLLFLN